MQSNSFYIQFALAVVTILTAFVAGVWILRGDIAANAAAIAANAEAIAANAELREDMRELRQLLTTHIITHSRQTNADNAE